MFCQDWWLWSCSNPRKHAQVGAARSVVPLIRGVRMSATSAILGVLLVLIRNMEL